MNVLAHIVTQTVASFLIIYRMASGRGWTVNTDTEVLSQAGTEPIQLKSVPSVHLGHSKDLTATDHTGIMSSGDYASLV